MKLLFKKFILILFVVAGMPAVVFSQQKYHFKGQATIYRDEEIDTLKATAGQMARIHTMQKAEVLMNDHYLYEYPFYRNIGVRFNGGVKGGCEIYEGKEWGPDKLFRSVLVDGDCAVEFSALYIDEKNAADYRYHVVQNDGRELITWITPSTFKYTADGLAKYAYLGKFKYAPGQVLKIEVYNIKAYRRMDAMLIDWRKVEAAKLYSSVDYLSKRSPLPDNGYFSKGLTDTQRTVETFGRFINGKYISQQRPIQVKDFIETTSRSDIKFRADDSVQNIHFMVMNGERLYNYKVSLKREIGGRRDSISLGENNSWFNLYKEFWKNPGKYQITFTPKIYKHGGQPITLLSNLATNIKFTVLPALDKQSTISVKTLGYIIIILLTTGGFMFAVYRDSQKRKLKHEAQNRQIATLQLQSVRAQLNPHFIFNALAGIQNLMNKNEVENANKYLSKFARLTRNILDEGNKELTTIEQEISLLNDYLQMEQMRFGFRFNIEINEQEIDQQIEIPAMLLQPFTENAVKHGVSALKEKGAISIIITKTGSTLALVVKDNGKGFGATNGTGMGLKLCEDRIALLNQVYKNTNILLHTASGNSGTLITIELQNWL